MAPQVPPIDFLLNELWSLGGKVKDNNQLPAGSCGLNVANLWAQPLRSPLHPEANTNPKTLESFMIAPRRVIAFRPSSKLK